MVAAVRIARSWWRRYPVWGWSVVAAVTAALVAGVFVLPARGATATLRPDGVSSTGWTITGTEPVLNDANNGTYFASAVRSELGYASVQDATGVLPAGAQISQIAITYTARADDTDEAVDFGMSINGVDDLLGDSGTTGSVAPGTTATQITEVFNAPTSWTAADLDTLQLHYKRMFGAKPNGNVYVTEAFVTVTYTTPTPTLTVAPGANRPTAFFAGQGDTGLVIDQIALSAASGQGDVNVSQLVVRGLDSQSSLTDDAVAVRLYRDDGDGIAEPGTGDAQLGTQQVFSGATSGSTAMFGGLAMTVTQGTTTNVWVVYDVGATAVDGHVVGSSVWGSGSTFGTNGTDVTVGAGQSVTTFTNVISSGDGLTARIDAAAPTVDTSSPASDAVLTGASVTVSGTVSDGAGAGVANVELAIQRSSDGNYWNGTGWQAGLTWNTATVTATWAYDWSLDAGQDRENVYTITARATDAVGLIGVDPSPTTVRVDNVGPSLTSAVAVDATTVDVVFTEPVDPASIVAGDFAISGGLTLSAAALQADDVTVRLTTSDQAPGTAYTVSVPGVVNDVAGNADTDGTAGFSGYVPTPVLTVSAGSDVPAAKTYVLRGSPSVVDQLQLVASSGAITVQSIAVNGIVSGGVLGDLSAVRLYVDDGNDLFDAADAQLGSDVTFSGATATFQSLGYTIPATATRRIWIVYLVGSLAPDGAVFGSSVTSGDVVTAAPATVSFPVGSVVSANTGATVEVDAYAPTTTIVAPAAGAVLTASPYLISGTASDDPDGAGARTGSGVAGVEISIARSDGTWWDGSGWVGAETWVAASATTNWTYAWPLPAAENETYSYTVSARSTDAVTNMTTVPAASGGLSVDTLGPTITSVPAGTSATEVDVVFSEPLDPGTIVAGDFSVAGLTITGAVLQADTVTVRLTTSPQSGGQLYTVQVAAGNITDVNGVANPATSRSFTGYAAPVTAVLSVDGIVSGQLAWVGTSGVKVSDVAAVDAAYIYNGTKNSVAQDVYSLQDPGAGWTIDSVTLHVSACDLSTRGLTLDATLGGTALDTFSPALTGSFAAYSKVLTPPAGGWTVANLSTLQIGVAPTVALNSTNQLRVDAVYVEVVYQAPAGGTLTVVQATEPPVTGLPDAPGFVTRGAVQVVDAYELSASGGDIPIDSITVTGLDTQNLLTADVSVVRLYADDGDGAFEPGAGDAQLGADGIFDSAVSGVGKASFIGLDRLVANGSMQRVWVAYVIGGSAVDGDKLGARLTGGSVLVTSGTVDSFADITSGGAGQTLTVDAVGPTAAIGTPVAGAVLAGSTATVTGSASDGAGAGIGSVQVRIARSDGTWYDRVSGTFTVVEAWNTVDTTNGYATWSMPWTLDVAQDRTFTYTVSARATDVLLQTGTAAVVTNVQVDTIGPRLVSASALDEHTIDLALSEAVDPATVMADGTDFGVSGATVTAAAVQPGDAVVRLTLAAPMVYGQAYTVSAAAGVISDAYGNLNPVTSTGFTYQSTDTIAPVMSTDVSATAGAGSPVIATVTWSAATDDVGVAGYRVYRATSSAGVFSLVGTTSGLSYEDRDGVPGQSYWYRVSAYDAADNESAPYPTAGSGPAVAGWTQAPHAVYSATTTLCKMCHDPHLAASDSNILRDAGATPAEVAVCYACHDGSGASTNIKTGSQNSFALASGHSVEASATGADLTNTCSSCHDPHSDFTATSSLPNRSINGASVTTADNTWCYACHNATNDWYEGSYPAVTAPSYDATGFPVTGTFPGPATYADPARNAHASIAASATIDREAGDCLYCHSSHRSASSYDSLIAEFKVPSVTDAAAADYDAYAGLCFTCHGTEGHYAFSGRPAGAADIQQFVTAGGPRSGHRIKTDGGTLPVGAPLPCFDCHNPHGSTRGNGSLLADPLGASLETSTAAGVRAFCFTCHTTADTAKGWDSASSALTVAAAAGKTIEGLPRDAAVGANVLRLPVVAGHNEADAQSCYSCHGASYAAGGANVHDPTGGESGGGSDCFGCHNYQSMQSSTGFHHYMTSDSAASYPAIADPATLTETDTRRTCLTCHVDHDYFVPGNTDAAHTDGRAQNFRASVATTPSMIVGSTYVNYDYSDVDTGDGGVCTSCHKVGMTKNTTGRNASADRSPVTAPVSDAIYDLSAHNYMATAPDIYAYSEAATFTSDSSAFAVNCGKCHNDTLVKQFQDGEWRFGLHESDIAALQTDNGQTAVASDPQEQLCWLCHSRADEAQPNNPKGGTAYAGDAPDMYGGGNMGAVMNSDSLNTKGMFSNAAIVSRHPVTGDGTTTARVECANCHNPHKTEYDLGFAGASGVVQDPDNTLVGSGVDGDQVWYGGPAMSVEVQANAAFCLRCHDGTPPVSVNDGTSYVPYDVYIPSGDAAAMNKGVEGARGHWAISGAIGAGEEVPCATCHDKHGSTLPKLLGTAIDPTAAPTVAGAAVTGNNNTICAACHTGASADFPAGEAQRDAAGYLGTGTWPGLAAYQTAYVPATHTGSPHTAAEATNGYAAGDCKNCHDVHGTAYTYDETVANFDPTSTGNDEFALCFTCHDGVKGTDIKALYPVSAGGTGTGDRSGHRIVTTVAGAKLAAGDALPCYDCHNPHGTAGAYSLQVRDIGDAAGEIDLSTAGGVRGFCFACHATADTAEGWSGSSWTAVGTTSVEGFRRDGSDASVMRLPSVTGHNKADAQSCYACHGGPTSSSSANVHNPTGGISIGGADCYACHSDYQPDMEDGLGAKTGIDRALSYHHVLGSAANDGDTAFAQGSYPVTVSGTAQDVYCLSCHVDHDQFNSAKASNLRPDLTDTTPAGVAYDALDTTGEGVCTSCHATSFTKQGMGADQKNDGSTTTPKIAAGAGAGQFGASAHSYYATSTYGTATFSANCAKCHNDEQPKTFQTSTFRFGTHSSATRRMVSALGGAVADPLQEAHCYRCHSQQADALKTTGLQDAYGSVSMSAASERVYAQFGLASTHPVAAAGGDSVECESCHNPHVVDGATGKVTDPENGYATIAYSTDAEQAAFCLKCHDGSLPAYTVSGTAYVPYTVTQADIAINTKVDSGLASKGHWTDGTASGGSISAGETVSCAECHDNHGSAAPKLLGAYDMADGRNEINGTAVTANDKTVCAACHTSASGAFPLTTRQSGTGYPVAGVWPGVAVYDTAYVPATHTGSPHTTANGGGSSSLPSYVPGDCKVCHDVHGTANTYDELRPVASAVSFDNDTFTLCFDCHDTDGPASRNVRTYYPVSVGGAGGGSGHEVRTAGGNLSNTGGVVPCYDCHNAHGSSASYSLQVITMTDSTTTIALGDAAGEIEMGPTRTSADVRDFCFACHTTSDTTKGYNGTGLAVVPAGALFEGLDRTGGVLHLPAVSGHRESDTQSCYQCHGNDYSGLSTNNVHNPSGGVSAGGQDCYGCHAQYMSPMEDGLLTDTGATRATVYHHVLGSSTNEGDRAFAQGAYPVMVNGTAQEVYCLSCHVDHDQFNSAQASNLRGDYADTTPAGFATDYDSTSNSGVCTACHATSFTKQGMGTDQKDDGSTATPEVSAGASVGQFGASAHDYYATSSYGDTTSFDANCSKCHNDEMAKDFQTSTFRFGTHSSATRRMVSALGGAVADPLQEAHCYRCHSRATDVLAGTKKSTANRDWYGATTMTDASERVYAQFGLASRHPVAAAGGDSVECESCHNPHVVTGGATATKVTDPENGYNAYTYSTDAQQAAFCLKCHDGGLPVSTVTGTTYVPYSITQANTAINDKSAFAARGHWSQSGAIGSGEEVSCAECHDNHGSAAPKLLGAYDVASGLNKIGTTTITANDNSVCAACHTTATGTAYTRLANGYPNVGTWPGTTVYDGANGIHKGAAVVRPGSGLTGGDCKNCHDVHGTAYPYDELTGQFDPVNATADNYGLCLTCHDADGPSTRNIAKYYPTGDGGTADGGNFGHSIKTAGGTLAVGQGLPCYECHNPHGSAEPDGLLIETMIGGTKYLMGDTATEIGSISASSTDAGSVRRFCFLCHATAAGEGTDATGTGYTPSAGIKAGDLIVGLSRTAANKLKLSSSTADHLVGATSNCFDCHGGMSATSATNVHNPSGGAGNDNCLVCHGATSTERLDKMLPTGTTSYHHVLDSGTPDEWDTAYPTSQSVLECRSCHVDHRHFNGAASNLRGAYNDTPATATGKNTDSDPATGTGICMSCHTVAQTKNIAGQMNDPTQPGWNSATTPALSSSAYNASAHDYVINDAAKVGYGTTQPFLANCIKCHDDGATAPSARQKGTVRLAPHYSAESRIAEALGATIPAGSSATEENLCYTCHSGGGSTDGYAAGAMTARTTGIATQFTKSSRHNVAGYSGIHKADEYTAAPASVNGAAPGTEEGWWGTSSVSKHVECEDCHNPHAAQDASYVLTSNFGYSFNFPNDNNFLRGNTTGVAISGANAGVWGVDISGSASGKWTGTGTYGAPTAPTYNKVASATYEWQLCLKCHSTYAWGNNTPPAVPSGALTGSDPALSPNGGTQNAGTMTDVGKDFNPQHYAYHPLFQSGRNQPSNPRIYSTKGVQGALYDTIWDAGNARRDINGTTTGLRLTNTFVDGWTSTSLVTCSDCHNNDAYTASSSHGPHGSSNRWLLRGINTGIKVTTVYGTVYPNNVGYTAAEEEQTRNFCVNCHRRDVYGDGDRGLTVTTAGTADQYSRLDHNGGMNSSCDAGDKLYNMPTGCYNCHGGRGNDGVSASGFLHGTSMTRGDGDNTGGLVQNGTLIGDNMGVRFMNGASWDAHLLMDAYSGDGSAGCSTINASDSYSSCTQHTGVWGQGSDMNYYNP